jgi:hypothetical protein
MKIKDINESVAGPEKCWPGHRKVGTQPGTGKNAGKRVNDCEKIKEDNLKEFAPGSGGESGRWYTDDQMTDIVGDGWWQDLDVSGNMPKQAMIQEAQAWLDDQGYSVQVLNCKLNDDDMEWYIQGSFDNPGFANEGVAEGSADTVMFEIDSENAYNHVMKQFGSVVEWDGDTMVAPRKYWGSIQELAYSAGGEATEVGNEQGMSEGDNPEYDDEAGMADNNLETLERAVAGIDDLIQAGDNLPEWCQEKIAVAKSMLVAVWDYMESEEDSEEVDPEIDEMFEVMDLLAEELAAKHKVDVDTVWESFEALDDHMLYETAAWRRKEGKSKSGGLNAKGVASYRRENPGSKLQTAVTTKPSKLKPGSKAAKRRKSFCARMSGVKGPMKKPNGKPTRKALALRKWNC